jgi:hypothetical protein
MKKYTINGVEYNSIEQIPEEDRAKIKVFEEISSRMDLSKATGLDVIKGIKLMAKIMDQSTNYHQNKTEQIDSSKSYYEKGFFNSWQFKAILIVIAAALIFSSVFFG